MFSKMHVVRFVLFDHLANVFEGRHDTRALKLFDELIADDVTDKRIVVVGASQIPYRASENLLSIMISLIPVAGRYLMINIQTVLEAAKMA